MKQLILSLLILLSLATHANAAIEVVFVVSTGSGDGSNVTTAAQNSTTVDYILIAKRYWSTEPTLTDNQTGNTYSAVTAAQDSGDGTGRPRLRLYGGIPGDKDASHTWTLSGSFNEPGITVWGLKGVKQTSPIDQTSGAGVDGGTSIQAGSITPSEDNCIVICAAGYKIGTSGSINLSFTGNFIDGVNFFSNGGGGGYEIQTTATARNPTISWTGTNDASASIVSIKAAAATGSQLLRILLLSQRATPWQRFIDRTPVVTYARPI